MHDDDAIQPERSTFKTIRLAQKKFNDNTELRCFTSDVLNCYKYRWRWAEVDERLEVTPIWTLIPEVIKACNKLVKCSCKNEVFL